MATITAKHEYTIVVNSRELNLIQDALERSVQTVVYLDDTGQLLRQLQHELKLAAAV